MNPAGVPQACGLGQALLGNVEKASPVQTWRIRAQTWVEEMVLLMFAGMTEVLV